MFISLPAGSFVRPLKNGAYTVYRKTGKFSCPNLRTYRKAGAAIRPDCQKSGLRHFFEFRGLFAAEPQTPRPTGNQRAAALRTLLKAGFFDKLKRARLSALTIKKVDFVTFLSFGVCLRQSRKLPARPAKTVDTSDNQRASALRALLKAGFFNKLKRARLSAAPAPYCSVFRSAVSRSYPFKARIQSGSQATLRCF